jgi:purine nucleosidase
VAIALLIGSHQVNIRRIVATSGNVWAEEAAVNLRRLLSDLRITNIGVCLDTASEADRTQSAPLVDLGASKYIGAFSHSRSVGLDTDCGGVFELIKAANHPDLLVIGPCHALASAIRAYPEISDYVGRAFLMGGAIASPGNATEAAEFNFWFDPNAAEDLLKSRLPITLPPLDAIRSLRYSAAFVATLDPANPVTPYIRSCAEGLRSLPPMRRGPCSRHVGSRRREQTRGSETIS